MLKKECEVLETLLQKNEVELCSLSEIKTERTWDFSWPTLTKPRRFTDRYTFAADNSFFDILSKEVEDGIPYRLLESVGAFYEDNDIVLYGGSLLDIIFKRESKIKDFDLRLVGPRYIDDEELCVQRAKSFVSDSFRWLKEENERIEEENKENKEDREKGVITIAEVTVSRCRSTVSIHIPRRKYVSSSSPICFQLTFAPIGTVEELLQQCLPHCTRLAIKDRKVILDSMAKYCIESVCVVMDSADFVHYRIDTQDDKNGEGVSNKSRDLSSQIHRYMKYFEEKGFDIILPKLDLSLVPRRNLEYGVMEVLDLPCMIVVYDAIAGNKIMTDRMMLPKALALKSRDEIQGAYDNNPSTDVGTSIHHNIRCLVNEVYDQFKYIAKGEVYEHVFDYVPLLTPRMVDKSYETVTESLLSGTIETSKLTDYFSATSPHQVIEELLLEVLQKAQVPGKLPKPVRMDEERLATLVEKEKQQILIKIENLRDKMKQEGLEQLVIPYPRNISAVEALEIALYGKYNLVM